VLNSEIAPLAPPHQYTKHGMVGKGALIVIAYGHYSMSALGQKQTFAAQKSMPALPLKADMKSASACFAGERR
jgi:hypothetical protein